MGSAESTLTQPIEHVELGRAPRGSDLIADRYAATEATGSSVTLMKLPDNQTAFWTDIELKAGDLAYFTHSGTFRNIHAVFAIAKVFVVVVDDSHGCAPNRIEGNCVQIGGTFDPVPNWVVGPSESNRSRKVFQVDKAKITTITELKISVPTPIDHML